MYINKKKLRDNGYSVRETKEGISIEFEHGTPEFFDKTVHALSDMISNNDAVRLADEMIHKMHNIRIMDLC